MPDSDTLAALLYVIGGAIVVIDLILVVYRRIDAKIGGKNLIDILKRTGVNHTAGLPPTEGGIEKRFAKKSLAFALVGLLIGLAGFFVETCGKSSPNTDLEGAPSVDPMERDQLDLDSGQGAPSVAQRQPSKDELVARVEAVREAIARSIGDLDRQGGIPRMRAELEDRPSERILGVPVAEEKDLA